MEYKVVSIVPVQKDGGNAMQVAQDFEDLIKKYNAQGWTYVRVESLKTYVAGNNGCFGFGSTAGYFDEKQMVVFTK